MNQTGLVAYARHHHFPPDFVKMRHNQDRDDLKMKKSRGMFQLGVKQEKKLLKPIFKQEYVTFMSLNKEVKINNIKPFPVNWT